ncbi:hypothetical protein [Bizionia sp.]|uniref:hypothetical protein n=1 Tax=Bizionia sp. TaxID=1954480 RepID=UPI003A901312
MKKQIRFLIIIPILICFINHTYSQNNRQKTILYDYNNSGFNDLLGFVLYSYCANGYVSKNKFVENQNLTFLMQINTEDGSGRFFKDTIISGKYYTKSGHAYIDGIWKKWDKNFKKQIKIKGVFKVSNIRNSSGITTKKKLGIEPTIHLLSNNPYNIKISLGILKKTTFHKYLNIESNITLIKEESLNLEELNKHILKDEKVKFSFNNGDDFIGSVQRENSGFYYSIQPYIGLYKFKTGESINGEIRYLTHYKSDIEFLPGPNSTTSFSDQTTQEGDWVNKYTFSLNYKQKNELFHECKSLTELKDKGKALYNNTIKKEEDKKNKKEEDELEKLQKQLKRQKELTSKYGKQFGEHLSRGELLSGMNKAMVNEVWKKEFFNISSIVRDGQNIEIWEFDKQKMQSEIIKEAKKNNDGESAVGALMALELSENIGLGGLEIPKMLVFKNNKLTDIYR